MGQQTERVWLCFNKQLDFFLAVVSFIAKSKGAIEQGDLNTLLYV